MFNTPFQQPKLQTQQHAFSTIPSADIPRSSFNRSHGYKTTFDAGYLVPCFVDEALPGDTMKISMTSFARLATPIAPIMDNLYCDVHFFAVPIRLLWSNWEKFNGAQENPGDSTDFLLPQLTTPGGGHSVGSLADYFGLPTGVASVTNIHCLAHRAYNRIFNDWYKDQNLQTKAVQNTGDGPDAVTDYPLRRRNKRHDYFTSALPWPQKGPAVTIPIGSQAPIIGLYTGSGNTQSIGAQQPIGAAAASSLSMSASGSVWAASKSPVGTGPATAYSAANSNVYADLSLATAATINQLREASQMQSLFERDARGGTRYVEIVHSHFGVTSPDARLQRAEFLGGGSTPVNVAPIPQTSGTGTTPQGNLAAMGTFSHSGVGFTKSFVEHCVVLGLMSVRADLNYQQGVNRMWSRKTRYDFYWPALAHLGEQSIKNREIYAQGTSADDTVFGYQERYAEYRYKPSQITGKLRSTAAGTLNLWHLAQHFTSLPVLGDTFIQENPPVSRVIAVPTEPHFIFDSAFHFTHVRPMPVYSVPDLMGRI